MSQTMHFGVWFGTFSFQVYSRKESSSFSLTAGIWPGALLLPTVPKVRAEPNTEPVKRLTAPNLPIDMVIRGLAVRCFISAVTDKRALTSRAQEGITASFRM